MIRKVAALGLIAVIANPVQADYLNKNKVSVNLNDFVQFQHVVPQRIKSARTSVATNRESSLFKTNVLEAVASPTTKASGNLVVGEVATADNRVRKPEVVLLSDFWDLIAKSRLTKRTKTNTVASSTPVTTELPVIIPPVVVPETKTEDVTPEPEPVPIIADPIKTTTDGNTIDDSTLVSGDHNDQILNQNNNGATLDNLGKDNTDTQVDRVPPQGDPGFGGPGPDILSAPAPATGILAMIGISGLGLARMVRRRKS